MNRSIYGGSTMVLLARFNPAEVREAFERAAGGLVGKGYGLTEAAPVTHGNPLGRMKKRPIGVPCPGTDAGDEANQLLPPGCMGELVVRGPQVMASYGNRPDETALVSASSSASKTCSSQAPCRRSPSPVWARKSRCRTDDQEEGRPPWPPP